MSTTTTPTYRVELSSVMCDGRPTHLTHSAWDSRAYRRPTDEHLATWVDDLIRSTRPGGINEQLGQLNIGRAKIVHQASGRVVAEYVAPLSGDR